MGLPQPAEIVAAIRAEAEKTPEGEVILCSPVGEPHFFHKRSYRHLEEAVLPDRRVLDQATSRHPVIITAWAPVRPGVMAANSRGLGLLGVTADSPDRIENVWVEKDSAGGPTGRLTGSVITYYAYDAYGDELINRLVPHFRWEVLLPSVRDGIERYKRLAGWTPRGVRRGRRRLAGPAAARWSETFTPAPPLSARSTDAVELQAAPTGYSDGAAGEVAIAPV